MRALKKLETRLDYIVKNSPKGDSILNDQKEVTVITAEILLHVIKTLEEIDKDNKKWTSFNTIVQVLICFVSIAAVIIAIIALYHH